MAVEAVWLGFAALPFVAYGIGGIWKHVKKRPRDPKTLLDERYARGEIGHDDYERRLSVLTYGPTMIFPPIPLIHPVPQELPAAPDAERDR